MTKFGVTSVSLLVLAVSAYSLQYPSYYMEMLLHQGIAYAIIRGVIVCLLMGYFLNPELRTGTTKRMLSLMGILLMLGAVLTFVSPTLFGHLSEYYPLGDTFIFLELGIWSKVASVELPVPEREPKPIRIPTFALSLLLWFNLTRRRILARPHRLLYTATGVQSFKPHATVH